MYYVFFILFYRFNSCRPNPQDTREHVRAGCMAFLFKYTCTATMVVRVVIGKDRARGVLCQQAVDLKKQTSAATSWINSEPPGEAERNNFEAALALPIPYTTITRRSV